jgi:hypothetical protein
LLKAGVKSDRSGRLGVVSSATVFGTTQFRGRCATSSALALCYGHRYISADLPEKSIQAREIGNRPGEQRIPGGEPPFPTPPTP